MIPFSVPPKNVGELEYIKELYNSTNKLSGDGIYTLKCHDWMEKKFQAPKVMLTTSGTSALELAAILCDIRAGDEVIMPSYTFVSTANAFVLRGAKICFVDIRPDTMNIDEKLIERAILPKTKVIVPVHYAGVGCDMDTIMDIANRHNLFVVEDAAQGFMGKYKGRYLGTIGDIGCYSFHDTKNYTMGEGGGIVLNRKDFFEKAEIVREKGTNRSKYFRGEIDKYTWVDIGSSYLPSDINAAILYAQLEHADIINEDRKRIWGWYKEGLKELIENEQIEIMDCPKECEFNAHIFWIKLKNLEERQKLIEYLKINGIMAAFHYVPLHSSTAGKKFGRFIGKDEYTTKESERIVRLPIYYKMKREDVSFVVEKIKDFFSMGNEGR